MKLLQNEEKLISSNGDKIVLTNHRITMTDEVLGKSYKISIFLEDISSIETHYKSSIVFLILGGIFALLTLGVALTSASSAAIGGLVVAAACIAIWWFSKKHIITISSKGGSKLNFIVEQMAETAIENFVNSVLEAKLKE